MEAIMELQQLLMYMVRHLILICGVQYPRKQQIQLQDLRQVLIQSQLQTLME